MLKKMKLVNMPIIEHDKKVIKGNAAKKKF